MTKSLFRLYLPIALITVLLSLYRFGHYTPDSIHYVDLARYFRGEVPRSVLFAPQAYRVAVPWVAAQIPIQDLDFVFAMLNLVATILAYFVFADYLKQFVRTRTELNLGILILVVSFPSFNYSTAVLTDAVGFLFLTVAVWLLLKKQIYAFAIVAALSVLIRDALLTLVPLYILWSYFDKETPIREKINLPLGLVILLPTIVYWIDRAYFADIGGYYRPFAIDNAISIFIDPIYWITSFLTIFPPLFIFFLGIRHSGLAFIQRIPHGYVRLLLSITLVYASILVVGISGRYLWSLYLSIIPVAVLANSDNLFIRLLRELADKIFGDDDLGLAAN